MANYYTEASFIVPCSADQAAIAIEALDHISDQFTDQANQAISKADNENLCDEEKIIRHCFYNHPEQTPDNFVKELEWEFDVEPHNDGLWVHANESINTEHAAIFTQSVLAAFNLLAIVIIEASHTCSKQRLDAFGGHACVVSKDFIRWDGLADFVSAEILAHNNRERYFMCEITEVNGEYEYPSRFLMKCSAQDDPNKCLNNIFVNYRGEGDKESDDFVWYGDGTAAKNPSMHEITHYEYKVMQAHLSTL